MSYAMPKLALDTGGIWSIARGLARDVERYKAHLANCELPRRNDLDGRGNLSEEALAEFAKYFLEACIDQVVFMASLIKPDELHSRIKAWAVNETQAGRLPAKADKLMEVMLHRGKLSRREVGQLLDLSDRSARRVTSVFLERGVLISESTRSPLHLAFPATLASRWMPGLFPDKQ